MDKQLITGEAIAPRKPGFGRQHVDQRQPHCRHELSLEIASRGLTTSIQMKKEDARTKKGVARAEVSVARSSAWRESGLHWGTCGCGRRAGTNTVTCARLFTQDGRAGPDNLLERNHPATWPCAGQRWRGATCGSETLEISLHAFSFARPLAYGGLWKWL